jgi:hypothetical protein
MTSKKITNHIDTGLWYENANGVIASAFWDLAGWEFGGEYILNYHQGEMPAFNGKRYETLDELETAMREFEPDLRKWRYQM